MIENIDISVLKFLPGASGGLPQKTAYLKTKVTGDLSAWKNQVNRLPNRAKKLENVFSSSHDNNKILKSNILSSLLIEGNAAKSLAFALLNLCLAIQREARDPVWMGRALRVDKNSTGCEILFALPYDRNNVLRDSIKWSSQFWLLWGSPYTSNSQEEAVLEKYRSWLVKSQSFGVLPNTLQFALSAYKNGWPVHIQHKTLHIGWGFAKKHFDSSFTSDTSVIATRIARDKHLTSQILRENGFPVPSSRKVADWDSACKTAHAYGWPVVIKPVNQDQGIGVVPNIRNQTDLREAYDRAMKYSANGIIVEKHIAGEDYRLLVAKGRLLMAVHRKPGGVYGDGIRTVEQLVKNTNKDPRRGTDKRSEMIALSIDYEAISCLKDFKFTPQSILPNGVFVPLRRIANISKGGTAEDVTNKIHKDNRLLAERAARVIGLDIAGVDFLTPDISRSWRETGGGICEINAQPGFRPHWLSDPKRDINGEVLKIIFENQSPRIPTAAITGTNGKTTVSRMLHHIWQKQSKVAGVCTTQGVWIGNEQLTDQNLSGYPGARLILAEPAIEAAVFEIPRKGLIRFGHPCDKYDVAALLNVQDDHIGVDGIETLDDMAQLKAQVLARASKAIVVNADDTRCLDARRHSRASRHILVARSANNSQIRQHRANGGEAVFISEINCSPTIIYAQEKNETQIMKLYEVPAVMHGLLKINEVNTLFAVALAISQNIHKEGIRNALRSFESSLDHNPGRYNFISGLPFQLILDYGHNPQAIKELFEIINQIQVSGRKIFVSTIGNRFYHHLESQAPFMAQEFDEIYLTQNEAYFSRNAQGFKSKDKLGAFLNAAKALIQPLLSSNQRLILGRDDKKIVEDALQSAKKGDLVVLLAESRDVKPIIDRIRPETVDCR